MTGWTAIVVAKPWRLAKSRLRSPQRAALARAFTLDVLDAVTGAGLVERVVVVSAERALIIETRRRDIDLIVDRPLVATGGLNTAVNYGWHWAQRTAAGDPVVVLPADLPCLTAGVLDKTLTRLAEHERAFVPDLGRGGTTLISAACPVELRSAYGPDSAVRHERLGLTRLDELVPAVRRDVDTWEDLAEAYRIGVGPHTAAVPSRAAARASRFS